MDGLPLAASAPPAVISLAAGMLPFKVSARASRSFTRARAAASSTRSTALVSLLLSQPVRTVAPRAKIDATKIEDLVRKNFLIGMSLS